MARGGRLTIAMNDAKNFDDFEDLPTFCWWGSSIGLG